MAGRGLMEGFIEKCSSNVGQKKLNFSSLNKMCVDTQLVLNKFSNIKSLELPL